jgi:serine phosphatase RsbU (regulator of sigma subunit)
VTLAPGDSVLFYTDGLIERRHRPIDDGLARLKSVCTRGCGSTRPLGRLVESLSFDYATEDDVCVVRLSVTGAGLLEGAGRHATLAGSSGQPL